MKQRTVESTWAVRNKRKAERSTLNIEVLVDAVDWAIAEYNKYGDDPEENRAGAWSQGSWFYGYATKRILRNSYGKEMRLFSVSCGSSYCVAGNICAAAGDRFVRNAGWVNEGSSSSVDDVMPKGSKDVVRIADRAFELLGVEERDISRAVHVDLFAGYNTIEEVVAKADAIARHYGYDVAWRPIDHKREPE